MRERLVALAIALVAILAIGDRLHEASPATARGHVTTGQLAAPAPPEPDIPALASAAVNPSVTAQTVFVVEPKRHLDPLFHVVGLSHSPSLVARRSGKPRSFPLLI